MALKPDLVEYFRTMLKGNYVENDRLEAKLDTEGWGEFATLLGIVFFLAVNRRLNERASEAEIVQFVAEMRSAAPMDAEELDANAAERLVKAALDPDIETDIDPEMAGAIQGVAIMHVLGEGKVSDHEIDALLREAVEAANRVSG
mgnify:CR=1 FL=1